MFLWRASEYEIVLLCKSVDFTLDGVNWPYSKGFKLPKETRWEKSHLRNNRLNQTEFVLCLLNGVGHFLRMTGSVDQPDRFSCIGLCILDWRRFRFWSEDVRIGLICQNESELGRANQEWLQILSVSISLWMAVYDSGFSLNVVIVNPNNIKDPSMKIETKLILSRHLFPPIRYSKTTLIISIRSQFDQMEEGFVDPKIWEFNES